MRLKPYPEYASSGHAWLGEIPTGWQVRPSKTIFGLRNEPERAGDVHLTPSQTHGVLPQVDYMKVTGNKVVLALAGTTMKHVEENDFVIHLRSFQGGIEWSGFNGKVSPAYTVLYPKPGVHPGYFRYLLKSRGYVETIASLTDQLRDGQSMRYFDFGKTPLPLPSFREQQDIASYLDRETAEISAFIADQGELIGLLNERRAATITQVVTKGLDPNAKMRDSGCPWIGEVPISWEIRPSKSLFANRSEKDRQHDMHLTPSQTYGVLPQKKYMEITGSRVVLSLAGNDMKHVEVDDFVIHLRSFQGGIEWSGYSGKVSPAYTVLTPREDVVSAFFKYLLKSRGYVQQIASLTDQLRDGQSMRYKDFGMTPLPTPPVREQRSIAMYLGAELAEIDAAIIDAEHSIELSKERRSALISAAVTGKIDVREQIFVEGAA